MNTIIISLLALAVIAPAFAYVLHSKPHDPGRGPIAVNIGAGTHETSIPLLSDEAVTLKHLLVTRAAASDADHFALCQADEEPIGICPDEVAADEVGESRAVHLLSRGPTRLMVASEAIAKDDYVVTAAAGKVQDDPAVAGTYYIVGRALSAAGADGDEFEVETFRPIKYVVLAALTSTNGTAAGAADLAALKTEAEKIGDDVRAIGAALVAPALLKVLAA